MHIAQTAINETRIKPAILIVRPKFMLQRRMLPSDESQ